VLVAGGIPGEVPVDGGVNLTVIGQNFGSNLDNIRDIRVGGISCTNLFYLSRAELQCLAPAGVGTGHFITVETRGGLISTTRFPAITYAAPVVSGLEPRFAFSNADRLYDFNITGSSLGLHIADIETLTVGGSPCTGIELISSRLIRCVGVRAEWSSVDVAITTKGQASVGLSLFEFLPPPSVNSLSPSVLDTDGGTVIRVSGEGMGTTASELVDVMVGDSSCLSFEFESPSSLTCIAPAGIGTGHTVTVLVRNQSPSSGGPNVSYERPLVASAAVFIPGSALGAGGDNDVLIPYTFGGSESIDIGIRAAHVGVLASGIDLTDGSTFAFVEDAAGTGTWKRLCESLETWAGRG